MDSPFEIRVNAALAALKADPSYSLAQAEKHYDVSRQTLRRRRAHGLSQHEAQEPQQLLSCKQEEELANWILQLEATGNAPSHDSIRQMAAYVARQNGHTIRIGKRWLERFWKRNPRVHSKRAIRMDHERTNGANKQDLNAWFIMFRGILDRLKVDPANVWNMDETGTELGAHCHHKVAGSSESTKTVKRIPKGREWVTVVKTVSAAGGHIRCLTIFKGKNPQSSWFQHEEVPDWLYCCSEKAFTSDYLSKKWLEECFLPETKPSDPSEPRILLLDGHGSHATIDFQWLCFQNNVYCVYLPAHCSHVLQPLDLSVFSKIKASYRKQIDQLSFLDDDTPIKKIRFVKYYNQARGDALTVPVILAGWRAGGLFPWNPSKVLNSKQVLENQAVDPISTPKRRRNSATDLQTPQNKRQLMNFRALFVETENSTRRGRSSGFAKVVKFVEKIHFEQAKINQVLTVQAMKLAESKANKDKKVIRNPNQQFINIKDIKRAQEASLEAQEDKKRKKAARQARKQALDQYKKLHPAEWAAKEAEKTATAIAKKDFQEFCSSWHISDFNAAVGR